MVSNSHLLLPCKANAEILNHANHELESFNKTTEKRMPSLQRVLQHPSVIPMKQLRRLVYNWHEWMHVHFCCSRTFKVINCVMPIERPYEITLLINCDHISIPHRSRDTVQRRRKSATIVSPPTRLRDLFQFRCQIHRRKLEALSYFSFQPFCHKTLALQTTWQ